jgi:hypothetical protein
MIKFFFKVLKLGLIIIHICYFLGMIWFIITKITYEEELEHQKLMSEAELSAHNTDAFLTYYDLLDNTATRNTIIGTYFAFTTLSTVGFGDFTPRSNVERSIGAFILISGVAMFSFLMGNFIEILSTYNTLHANLDDGDTLAKFFGTLVHFNDGDPIDTDMKKKIEEHFDYLWKNDRN